MFEFCVKSIILLIAMMFNKRRTRHVAIISALISLACADDGGFNCCGKSSKEESAANKKCDTGKREGLDLSILTPEECFRLTREQIQSFSENEWNLIKPIHLVSLKLEVLHSVSADRLNTLRGRSDLRNAVLTDAELEFVERSIRQTLSQLTDEDIQRENLIHSWESRLSQKQIDSLL
jgi:hypothetical protein